MKPRSKKCQHKIGIRLESDTKGHEPGHSSTHLTTWVGLLIGVNFLKFNGVVLSVVGDVFIDSEMLPVVILSISRICRLDQFSKILIKVEFAFVYS